MKIKSIMLVYRRISRYPWNGGQITPVTPGLFLTTSEILRMKEERHVDSQNFQRQAPDAFFKMEVLKISQNSQENACARFSFLIKLQSPNCYFINKEPLAQVFSQESAKISRTIFL